LEPEALYRSIVAAIELCRSIKSYAKYVTGALFLVPEFGFTEKDFQEREKSENVITGKTHYTKFLVNFNSLPKIPCVYC
jgi:hypothetical protein